MLKHLSLENEKYLVTGSTGSLGHATVDMLAAAGATVYAGHRNEQKFKAVYPGNCSSEGYPVRPLMVDVASPASIEAAAARLNELLRGVPLDGLINNAGGIIRPRKGQPESRPTSWLGSPTFRLNCLGPLALALALNDVGVGVERIVNISSSGAPFFKRPFEPGEKVPGPAEQYNIAKFGLEAGGRALPGTVVSVRPPITPGGFFREEPLWMRAFQLGGRTPDVAARVVVHALVTEPPIEAGRESHYFTVASYFGLGDPTVSTKALPYLEEHPGIPQRVMRLVDEFRG